MALTCEFSLIEKGAYGSAVWHSGIRRAGGRPGDDRLRWATSRDGGLTWNIHETCPPLGRVRDVGCGSAPLEDGGTVTLTFSTTEPLQAIVPHGIIGYPPFLKRESQAGGSWVPEYIPRAVIVSLFDEKWLTGD